MRNAWIGLATARFQHHLFPVRAPQRRDTVTRGSREPTFCGILTGVRDRETVGGLQVVHVVVEVEGLLRHILVGVVELHGEPEGAVLLHRGAHEQPACTKKTNHTCHSTRTKNIKCVDNILG